MNVRSGILGNSGSAQEVRREFLVLMEDSARQPDISKSVQRFQLAVQEAKVLGYITRDMVGAIEDGYQYRINS